MAKERRLWRGVRACGITSGCLAVFVACSSHKKEPAEPGSVGTQLPMAATSQPPPPPEVGAERGTAPAVTPEEAELLAANAYIYAYPLVLMDVTRRVMTATARPDPETFRAPINQAVGAQAFPDPSFSDVVRPNFDTLYTSAWLDLSAEPVVVSVPDMGKRYYLLPMLDAWTNVIASPGTRTRGEKASAYVVTGPGYAGKTPEGMTVVHSPTRYAWMIGRIAAKPGADLKAARELESQIHVTPLSRHAAPSNVRTVAVAVDPTVDTKTAPPQQVAQMRPERFFARFAELTRDNPPSGADMPILTAMARLGIVPGKAFDASSLSPEVRAGLERGVARGRRTIEEQLALTMSAPGWTTLGANIGNYGTDYMTRAKVALGGLGANLTSDAVYPTTALDSSGRPLDGKHRYVLRFSEPPPTKAFWSLTLYDEQGRVVKNDLDRYSLGSQHSLTRGPDGSVTLLIQADEPKDPKERANWLPAPRGPFNLTLRVYEPDERVRDGRWKVPAVERVD